MEHATDFYQRIENQKPTYAVAFGVCGCGIACNRMWLCVIYIWDCNVIFYSQIHGALCDAAAGIIGHFNDYCHVTWKCIFPYCFAYAETLMWFTRLRQRSFRFFPVDESHAQCISSSLSHHSSIWAQSILVWQLTRTGSVYNERKVKFLENAAFIFCLTKYKTNMKWRFCFKWEM